MCGTCGCGSGENGVSIQNPREVKAHEHHLDKGTAYEFKDAAQLLSDFFYRVNEIISELQNR